MLVYKDLISKLARYLLFLSISDILLRSDPEFVMFASLMAAKRRDNIHLDITSLISSLPVLVMVHLHRNAIVSTWFLNRSLLLLGFLCYLFFLNSYA